ncbi:piggyBac transposable element-derived protein 4-like [Aplysia californica]|uniref:PiggyBac transposable element-derived protein 4-like n=1 Tax=Aplysia californica TaxID=6500 RepID=A0ABM1VTV8_APLCA|nr:piggyBac transposable element-derived protein 4-like [Aplysia californica]
MRTFIGILLLMGLLKKPDINSYWCRDPLFTTPVFSAAMPRDRFLLLLKFWHLNNNTDMPAADAPWRDRLFKPRPVLTHLLQHFQAAFEPGQDTAIDESLLLWKGRLLFKQYIPLKRARFGIKSFMLCDSSGYTYRFRVYTGKDENTEAMNEVLPEGCASMGCSAKEVVHLMLPLLNKGHKLFVDNWYSSVDLFSFLHSKGTSCCGTLRANRAPLCLRQLQIPKGRTESCVSEPLLAQKFVDKRDVYMLTTCHPPQGTGEKPPAIVEYNQKMGAVDRHDQMLQPYDATRKSLKWYKKLCIRFIQIGLLNAFILYQKAGNEGTFLSFQKDVLSDLIFGDGNPADAVEDDHSVRLYGRHFVEVLPATEKKARPQKKCRVCARKGTRRDTRYYCPDCPSKPGLCLVGCYKKYHTERFFWRQ